VIVDDDGNPEWLFSWAARIDVMGEARTAEILARKQLPNCGTLDIRVLREIALRNRTQTPERSGPMAAPPDPAEKGGRGGRGQVAPDSFTILEVGKSRDRGWNST
jgi:hypothetical protein